MTDPDSIQTLAAEDSRNAKALFVLVLVHFDALLPQRPEKPRSRFFENSEWNVSPLSR